MSNYFKSSDVNKALYVDISDVIVIYSPPQKWGHRHWIEIQKVISINTNELLNQTWVRCELILRKYVVESRSPNVTATRFR